MVDKYIADYLIDKNNIIFYLIFVFFFSILFVNVFTPFQGAWYNSGNVTRYQLFMYTLFIVMGGSLILAVSRTLMCIVHKRNRMTYLHLIFWCVMELILIAMLYAVGCRYGLHDTRSFSLVFGRALMYIPTILLIPTIITVLYLGNRERDRIIAQLKDAVVTTDNIPAPADVTPTPTDAASDIVNFTDEKGDLKLSVKSENIYYLEASDNYINIFYRNKEEITQFILRSSMKKQEELLSPRGFVRCHRSYLVNFSKVALLRKDKYGPYLDLGENTIKEIPVSKTYFEEVVKHFTFQK